MYLRDIGHIAQAIAHRGRIEGCVWEGQIEGVPLCPSDVCLSPPCGRQQGSLAPVSVSQHLCSKIQACHLYIIAQCALKFTPPDQVTRHAPQAWAKIRKSRDAQDQNA